MYTRDTELRRLQSNDVNRLAEALGFDGGRKLMETIPKHWTTQDTITGGVSTTQGSHKLIGDLKTPSVVELKYRPEQIRLIEEATKQTSGCYFAEILIQEWSTSGRKHERPTVGLLLHLLIKADLWNAADFVAEHFLNEPAPERPLEGPGAKVDISIPTECLGSVAEFVNDSNGYPDTETLNENVNSSKSITNHNRDYYMKFAHFSKDINGTAPKPPPRPQRAARQQQQQQQQQQQNIYNRQQQQPMQTNSNVNGVKTGDINQSKQVNLENLQQASKQQQQNTDTSISSTMTAHNIPELSDLLDINSSQHSSRVKHEVEVVNEAPMLTLLDANNTSKMSDTLYSSNTPVIASSSTNVLPKSQLESNVGCESLPLITELNLDTTSGEGMSGSNVADGSHSSKLPAITSSSPNHSSDDSRCSSLSNDSFDEDDDVDAGNGGADELVDGYSNENSLPYLSVFGRQSPNNDSSLTTVTCTSGENSFELSLNDSSSTSTTDPTALRK